MLRLDVDKDDLAATDNPFVGRTDVAPEIWAYGLRNPWRCSFDMAGDRQLFCARRAAELLRGGQHRRRGAAISAGARWKPTSASTTSTRTTTPRPATRPGSPIPILVYNNCTKKPQGCLGISVTGGYVYRGSHQAWAGKYIFGDWSKSFAAMDGQIFFGSKGADGKWTLEKAVASGMATLPYMLAFAQDERGDVYALTSISTGPVGGHDKIYRILPAD